METTTRTIQGAQEMTIYMKVTKDKYELPVAIANSVQELARICNTTANNIYVEMWQQSTGKRKTSRYHKVEVEDD